MNTYVHTHSKFRNDSSKCMKEHTYIHTWNTILTSSSGDVRHLVSEAGLLHRGHRVAPSDDGDAALAGQRGQRRSDGVRALGEGIELEHYTKNIKHIL